MKTPDEFFDPIDGSHEKTCEDCGAAVFWVVTDKGCRLFEHNPEGEDKRHVCLARIDREIKQTGVTLNLKIPEFKNDQGD